MTCGAALRVESSTWRPMETTSAGERVLLTRKRGRPQGAPRCQHRANEHRGALAGTSGGGTRTNPRCAQRLPGMKHSGACVAAPALSGSIRTNLLVPVDRARKVAAVSPIWGTSGWPRAPRHRDCLHVLALRPRWCWSCSESFGAFVSYKCGCGNSARMQATPCRPTSCSSHAGAAASARIHVEGRSVAAGTPPTAAWSPLAACPGAARGSLGRPR